jgi:predicted metalloprotease with PDZ domain
MKLHHRILGILLLSFPVVSFSQSNAGYKYTVDLTRVVDDRVYVELSTPRITTSETVFYLPKMIPGTYKIADYGRFVVDLKAMDKKGKQLPVEKFETNGWRIKNAQKLSKISYWVDDITDTQVEGPDVYPMAATNIEEGKNFVINTSGFFGYFENTKDVPFNFDVIKHKDLYGGTGLVPLQTDVPLTTLKLEKTPENSDKRVDRYSVENYDRLIDSPLMYSKPDTAVIQVANTEVLISCYSPNGKVNSKDIANTVRETLMAQKEYLGGKLPVDKYAFIFYFTDQPINVYGALEHSYSSFYYMPEQTIDEMRQQLRDFAAHEFFHIVTPLTIHSNEIHRFDFNQPAMSKHLWLYEGVTEYFAGNVQVKYGIITPEQYLEVIRQKMTTSTRAFKDTVAFTDISKFTLDLYSDQYGNVYQKGALIGMCLDIRLRQLSNGKYGMQNLIADLSKKYGKDKAFADEELFSVIEQMTYPQIGEFFKRHVAGNEPLPFREVMEAAGINYISEQEGSRYSLGYNNGGLKLEELEGKKKIAIASPRALDEQGKALGLQAGDILLKVNNENLPDVGPDLGKFLTKQSTALQEGASLSYTIARKNQEGKYETVELTAPIVKVKIINRNLLSFNENATPAQLAIRNSWLSAK